jgi:hypothetical protein
MPPTSPSRSTDREGVAKQVMAYVAEQMASYKRVRAAISSRRSLGRRPAKSSAGDSSSASAWLRIRCAVERRYTTIS